jgi:protein O-GlcNAc transferase
MSTFPNVQINVVDFASIKFRAQVALLQKTDVLVGVTGAGLTHALFLQPRSCLVEIQSYRALHRHIFSCGPFLSPHRSILN